MEVHQHHVEAAPRRQGDGLLGGGRLTGDPEVRLGVQHRAQPRPDHRMVVREQQPDRLPAPVVHAVTPDSGEVVVAGTPTAGLGRGGRAALRRDHIGIVFQQPNLLPSLTAAEQLQVMRHLPGGPARSARRRALELMDAVGLADRADRRPHQLWGGKRQRINIARALMNEPAVLLVDEPTSALDHVRGAAVLDLLVTLTRERATATVLVTHDLAHLERMDRTVTMDDGRLTVPAHV
ncbi:ABC transporter ATP-binding protein [Streptomyces sp. NPDC058375]|uniref:ABC transporter ATP-binding protein n=1 Tax=Streptomyces sp. NPDC058375 TaxID=3346467 RepID=UPI00365D74BE